MGQGFLLTPIPYTSLCKEFANSYVKWLNGKSLTNSLKIFVKSIYWFIDLLHFTGQDFIAAQRERAQEDFKVLFKGAPPHPPSHSHTKDSHNTGITLLFSRRSRRFFTIDRVAGNSLTSPPSSYCSYFCAVHLQGCLEKSLKWLLINYQILLPNFLVFSCEWLGEFDIASKIT